MLLCGSTSVSCAIAVNALLAAHRQREDLDGALALVRRHFGLLDFDDDHLAEGSSPMNWDTDGDWMNDWFEVRDDEEDGVRGDSSPIRYDSRQTS